MAGSVPSVRGVIFDWGGVLTTPIAETVADWLERERIDRASYADAMRPWFQYAYSTSGGGADNPIHALERGEMADGEFERALAAKLVTVTGEPVPADRLLPRMFAGSNLIDEMVQLVRDLRTSGLRTALLSNSWGHDNGYPWDLLDELFDSLVISGQVGMRKPEERIFRLATSRLKLTPEECVFIDDLEANVAAARALGFTAVLHSDPASTRAELTRMVPGLAAPPGAVALA